MKLGGNKMKITIEGTPNELNELLQAIGSSKEQPNDLFTFPEKGTVTLSHNRLVEREWIDENGERRTSTDITRMKS